jgi:hypothetical protein
MRLVGLELENPVPDAGTIGLYRERLARAGAIECPVRQLRYPPFATPGYLAMGGQIVDATVVEARRAQAHKRGKGDGRGRRRA